ncbi:MAG: hypothetical protein AB7P07_06460 [Hyphomonadaceae bacterium]
MRSLSAALGLALSAGACAGSPPPAELRGLWSAGDAACEMGVGVRFGADAIAAVYDEQREVLFKHPEYAVMEDAGGVFRVRVVYELPQRPGGARSVGAHGVLVLERTSEGGLALASHNLLDARTGSARVRIADDPAARVLGLEPCGDHPWRQGLRGRGGA